MAIGEGHPYPIRAIDNNLLSLGRAVHKRTAPGSNAWSGPCQILFYDAKPDKRLADGGFLLRPHLLDITSRGIPSVRDKSVLPLGLRDAGAVDVEAVLFLYPSANLLVGRHFCFRIEFALVVVCVDYEGEPSSVHRQTGFGNGVRIPNVRLNVAKMLFRKALRRNEKKPDFTLQNLPSVLFHQITTSRNRDILLIPRQGTERQAKPIQRLHLDYVNEVLHLGKTRAKIFRQRANTFDLVVVGG